MCYNPVLKTRYTENKEDPKINKIWKGGKITCYLTKIIFKQLPYQVDGIVHNDAGLVLPQFICGNEYGELYKNSGDENYKYYYPIGIVEQHFGGNTGYSVDIYYNYICYLELFNTGTNKSEFDWNHENKNFHKEQKELKINIFIP